MSSHHWKAAAAKAQFSKLLRDAEKSPQIIENRGQEVAVVLSVEEYRSLQKSRESAQPAARLAEFLDFSRRVRSQDGPELAPPLRANRPVEPLEA